MVSGADPATIRAWLGDLSFEEVHAMTYGAAHGAGTVVAYELGLNMVAIGLVLTLFVLNGWLATSKTEGMPVVRSIYNAIPRSIVSQIRRELHYYDGMFMIAVVATYLASRFVV